jgi:uncharacterized membrane protein
MLLELIATLCTGLFTGAAIYVNLVEHPARLEPGTAAAVKQWRPSYRRGTVMQASLAAVGFLSAVGAWLQGRGTQVLIAGLLIGLVVPFTLIVIFPTNKQLSDADLDVGSTKAADCSTNGIASTPYEAQQASLPSCFCSFIWARSSDA